MYISPAAFSYTHQSRDNTSYNAYLQYIPDSTLCTVLCALYFLRAETTVGSELVQIAMSGTNPSGTNSSGTNLSELVQIAGRRRGQSKA